MVEVWAVPGQHNLIDTINNVTGLTDIFGHDEAAVKQRYPDAVRMTYDAWRDARAAQQHTAIIWTLSDKQTYHDMLDVLPPARWIKGAFLVGEPIDHDVVSGEPRYQAYWYRHRIGSYLVASRPMTSTEFAAEMQRSKGGA